MILYRLARPLASLLICRALRVFLFVGPAPRLWGRPPGVVEEADCGLMSRVIGPCAERSSTLVAASRVGVGRRLFLCHCAAHLLARDPGMVPSGPSI